MEVKTVRSSTPKKVLLLPLQCFCRGAAQDDRVGGEIRSSKVPEFEGGRAEG